LLCAAGLAMVGGTITEELHSPMSDLFSLQGRSALITGGSRGIGRMIATGFLRQGARVYISARKAQACLETAKELSALGTCVALPHDVSTVEGAHALAAAYREHESSLDILVNNAGAAWGEDFDTYPEKGWDKVVDLNMNAIAPGAFASEMNKDARDNAEFVASRIPAGRIGVEDDMAGAAIYLASRAGDYVVGATLVVDGGVTHAR